MIPTKNRITQFLDKAWLPTLTFICIAILAWNTKVSVTASAGGDNPVIANRLCHQLWSEWGGGGGEAKYVAACTHSFLVYGDGREVGNCFIHNEYGETVGEGPCSTHQERGGGPSR